MQKCEEYADSDKSFIRLGNSYQNNEKLIHNSTPRRFNPTASYVLKYYLFEKLNGSCITR